jgi:KAP-like P-loop domain-containing protein
MSVQQIKRSPSTLRSGSVTRVLNQLPKHNPVDASEIVRGLFRLHTEYAGGLAASAHLEDTTTKRLPEEWLSDVESLFDFQPQTEKREVVGDVLDRLKTRPPELHGRQLIIGLCLLEPSLYRQLKSLGVFDALVAELRESLVGILTKRGHELYEGMITSDERSRHLPEESVPSLSDNPLSKEEEDLLGRIPFAKFLARRIQTISDRESGAYSIHIKGQWGSGKSSLLNFIRMELEGSQEKKWLVTEFNAWRNQQIDPPWWALMDKVFRDVKGKLSWPHRWAEYYWRFNSGRLHYILGLVTLLWLFVLFVFPALFPNSSQTTPTTTLGSMAANAENLSKIAALTATVWGAVIAINRSLLFGSAQAAKAYTELVNNPTEEIKTRFELLIKRLKPYHLAIVIDDLDRCKSKYVVDLLEGIQTLYREAPVVFIIAADERWLNACYEEVYEKLTQRVSEPGKLLGSLFLEKAFRFSTPMPGIPKELREKFWRHILAMKNIDDEKNKDELLKNAQEKVKNARSEQELANMVNATQGMPFVEERAMREAAVIRLAANEVQDRLEHTLEPYFELLEPNPRSMKRFVNSFSANRALAILSEVDIDLHQLALWTILSSRWPAWANTFARNPELLEQVRKNKPTDLNADLKQILEISDFQAVISGAKLGQPLEREILTKSARMQA